MFSGVENSGKSTLTQSVSEILGWTLIPEMCRQNDEVLRVEETPQTLSDLHSIQEEMALEAINHAEDGIICDTGGLELEMWSKIKFNVVLNLESSVKIDFCFFCETLPVWEEDPIRQMPKFKDRKQYETLFYEAHCLKGTPFAVLPPVSLDERIEMVLSELKSMINE